MSVRLCIRAVPTFSKPNRWADLDETWHVYPVGRGTKRIGSGILNYGPWAARER